MRDAMSVNRKLVADKKKKALTQEVAELELSCFIEKNNQMNELFEKWVDGTNARST